VVIKDKVARLDPHTKLLSTRNIHLNVFKNKINSQIVVGLWRKVLKNVKEYFESDKDAQSINEEFDDYGDSDNDA